MTAIPSISLTEPQIEESFFNRNFWKNVASEIPIFNTTFTLSFIVATAFKSMNASFNNFDAIVLGSLAAFPLVRKIDNLFLRDEYKEYLDFGSYALKANRESIKLGKLLEIYSPCIDPEMDNEEHTALLTKQRNEMKQALDIFTLQQSILHARCISPPVEKYHFFNKFFESTQSVCAYTSPCIALAGLLNKNKHSFTHFVLTASLYTSFRQYSFPQNIIFGTCLGIDFIDLLLHVAYKTSIYEQITNVQPKKECIPPNLDTLCSCPNNIAPTTQPHIETSSYFLPILTGMAAVTILGQIALKYYDKYQKNRANELAVQSLQKQQEEIKRFHKVNADYGFTEALAASTCFNDPKRYLIIKYPLSSLKFFKSLIFTSARVVGYIVLSLFLIPTVFTEVGRSYLRRNTMRIFTNLSGTYISLIGIGFPCLGSGGYTRLMNALHLNDAQEVST